MKKLDLTGLAQEIYWRIYWGTQEYFDLSDTYIELRHMESQEKIKQLLHNLLQPLKIKEDE